MGSAEADLIHGDAARLCGPAVRVHAAEECEVTAHAVALDEVRIADHAT